MSEYKAIAIFLFGSIIVGAVMYAIAKAVFCRKIEESKSPVVTKWGYFQAVIIVSSMLVLVWFMQQGHQWAAISFAIVMLLANICVRYYSKNSEKSS